MREQSRASPFEPAPPQPLVRRLVPVSRHLPGYGEKAPRDVVAGVTIAALAVPAAMAYAELCGVSAVHGLYALLVPVVAYALLGSSRQLAVGPEASLSALTGAAVLGLAAAGSAHAAALAAMLALLMAGCFALALVLRLGWVADYLSKPVLVGYLHGIAIVVVIAQLGKLLGLDIAATDPLDQLAEVARELGDTSGATVAVGAIALGLLLPARFIAPRFPAALLVVAGAIVASYQLSLADHGVAVVGAVPSGFPAVTLPSASWHDITTLASAGAALFLIGFADEILTARAVAGQHGDHIGVSQELRAMAVANASAGLTQGLPIGASNSRTAVNAAMGARSQVAGLVAAAVIVVILLFLTGPIAHLPKAVLGATIVVAATALVDLAAWRSLAAVDRVEVAIAGVTTAGVVVVGVLQAVTFAVALTIIDAVRRSAHPGDAVLGYDSALGRWANVAEHEGAQVEPEIVVYRPQSRIFFANASYVRGRIKAAVRGALTPTRWVVLDCEAVSHVDSTGTEMLVDLCNELSRRHIALVLGRVRTGLRRSLRASGALDVIGRENVHPTLGAAVDACRRARDEAHRLRA